MIDAAFLIAGIALLTVGGEALIRGALGVAERLGVSPLLSGLIIVGFGTSAPELVVSVNAVLAGKSGIAIGNVVGSNIGNVLLILGVCALIRPMTAHPKVLSRDAVAGIVASVGFIAIALGGSVARVEGLALIAALVGFMFWAYRSEAADVASTQLYQAEAGEVRTRPHNVWLAGVLVVGGLGMLIGGSQLFLSGAVAIARDFGIPDAVIGLTLVAVGTSLPELSISIIAAIRGHADVAIGNVLGSNLFNLLGILGVSAVIAPIAVPARVIAFDQWVMVASAIALALFLYTGRRISRIEAAVLLASYTAYIVASFTLVTS